MEPDAAAIRAAILSRQELSDDQRHAAENSPAELLDRWLVDESAVGPVATAICLTMSLLEAAMEKEPVVAGLLMAHLYPVANRELLHEVCDAIELLAPSAAVSSPGGPAPSGLGGRR
jgi:hypothetical protein